MLVKDGRKMASNHPRKICHIFYIYFWRFPFWEKRRPDRYYSGKPILKGSPLRRFRWFAAVSFFAAALPVACQTPRTKRVTDAEVAAITRDAILIDEHDDVTSRTVDGYNIATPNKRGQTDLARM